jgi:hypothetical protein
MDSEVNSLLQASIKNHFHILSFVRMAVHIVYSSSVLLLSEVMMMMMCNNITAMTEWVMVVL